MHESAIPELYRLRWTWLAAVYRSRRVSQENVPFLQQFSFWRVDPATEDPGEGQWVQRGRAVAPVWAGWG